MTLNNHHTLRHLSVLAGAVFAGGMTAGYIGYLHRSPATAVARTGRDGMC